MLNLQINNLPGKKDKVEIVERKGLGHPDTICDLLVDNLSIRLSQIYKKEFGEIPHYNIDKALLAAGSSENKFGGGKIIKPMLFVIGDRATYKIGKKKINLERLIKREIYAFLKKHYRFINEKNFIIQNEIKPGSGSLQDIFSRKAKFLPANDTSALVGYAPMTELEKMVFSVEELINSAAFKKNHPETGEDVKVMGQRVNNNFQLTLAIAFVDHFIKNEKDYFAKKAAAQKEIEKYLEKNYPHKVKILINTLDENGRGMDGCYLTVVGTSADSGDSGEVGRGNRVNGLIPLNRVAGSEAGAGKNCVSHVGKIYNLLAFKLAADIYKKTGKKSCVWLLSQIGQAIDKPKLISVQIENLKKKDKDASQKIVSQNFRNLQNFLDFLILGTYRAR